MAIKNTEHVDLHWNRKCLFVDLKFIESGMLCLFIDYYRPPDALWRMPVCRNSIADFVCLKAVVYAMMTSGRD